MMKRFNVIFLFICLFLSFNTSVFAYSNYTLESLPPGITVTDAETIVNSHYNDSKFVDSIITRRSETDYPSSSNLCSGNSAYCFYKRTNENIFGYFSNGSVVPSYYRSSSTELAWSHTYRGYTDSDGNFQSEDIIYDSTQVTFLVNHDLGNIPGVSYVRYDFNIKLVFYDAYNNEVWNKDTERIFSSFFVDCPYPTACNYDIDMGKRTFAITLNTNDAKGPLIARLYTIRKVGSLVASGNYNYKARIYVSSGTTVWTDSSSLSGVDVDDSVISGSNLMDNYIKLESNVNTLFDYFDDDHMHGLTQVVMAPQAFLLNIMQGNYDNVIINYNVNNDDLALSFKLFNKQFKIPSGKIFWNRGILSFHSDKYSTDSEKYRMLFNFRTTWSLLFGGFIIYKLLIKLYRVVLDSIQPDKERIESL